MYSWKNNVEEDLFLESWRNKQNNSLPVLSVLDSSQGIGVIFDEGGGDREKEKYFHFGVKTPVMSGPICNRFWTHFFGNKEFFYENSSFWMKIISYDDSFIPESVLKSPKKSVCYIFQENRRINKLCLSN